MSNSTGESSPQRISRKTFLKGAVALAATGGVSAALFKELSGSGQNRQAHEIFAAAPSWEQDFSKMPNGQPDPKFWRYVTGTTIADYNKEEQTYTDSPQNVRIEDGALVIEARREDMDGRHYTSGRIFTQNHFEFEHGKLEVDMKLPKGVGTWPAAWLLPNSPKYPTGANGWLINGEIDFAEAVGFMPGKVFPAAHTISTIKKDNLGINPPLVEVPDDTTEFHRYGVEKLPERISFTFDGQPYYHYDKKSDKPMQWPFEQNYYLILNLAMGGSWGGEHGIDNSSAPWKLEVSSVKYWPLAA